MQFVGVILFNLKIIHIAGSIIILMEQMKQQGSEKSNKLFTVTQLIRFKHGLSIPAHPEERQELKCVNWDRIKAVRIKEPMVFRMPKGMKI